MQKVITNILTNPEGRDKASVEKALIEQTDVATPWNLLV
jgi:hypothetical protein